MSIRIDRVLEDSLLKTISNQRAVVYLCKINAEERNGSWSAYYKAEEVLNYLDNLWETLENKDIIFHKRNDK